MWRGAGQAAIWIFGLMVPCYPQRQQVTRYRPSCYLIYPVWWHPLTPVGDKVQAWLLPDLSGLVTPSDPQRQPVTRWRPGCYLIYQVWPHQQVTGCSLAATWSIRSGDTLWPLQVIGRRPGCYLIYPVWWHSLTPSRRGGCRPGCYLIYPVWWHSLTPGRWRGAGLAAGITEAGLVGGAGSGAHHSTPAHRYRHYHVSCPPITTLRHIYIREKCYTCGDSLITTNFQRL